MNNKQIIKYIDDGALNYINLLGNSKNMEFINNDYYSIIRSKKGNGINFIYDIKLNNLTHNIQKNKINEMKSYNYPIWHGLFADETLYPMLYNMDKSSYYKLNEEIYMALICKKKLDTNINNKIIKVKTINEFNIWSKLANQIFFDNMINIDYYLLCKKGLLKCYILYYNDIPTTINAIAKYNNAASLEFVGTIKEMRNKGFATEICSKAINDVINEVDIITLRANNSISANIYKKLGFKKYNP